MRARMGNQTYNSRHIAGYWARAADAMIAHIDAAPLDPPPGAGQRLLVDSRGPTRRRLAWARRDISLVDAGRMIGCYGQRRDTCRTAS